MAFELLTDIDKEKIITYIKNYGEITPTVDLNYLLRNWNQSKDLFLTPFFKDKLIYEKEVEFFEDTDTIEGKLNRMIWEDAQFRCFRDDFFDKFIDNDNLDFTEDERRLLRKIIDFDTLARNKVLILPKNYPSLKFPYKFPLPNGKTVIIGNECKPMKIIRKFAEAYNIPNFQPFCNQHSLCLNTKKLKGKLCLSIHPLDYITMSDNESGWESCMSWIDGGDYRQGTVEMMNSQYIVVAYLKNDIDNFHIGNNLFWNNKKWRCLLVVDENFVISNRQYPYDNENLARAAVQEMGKLLGFGNSFPVLEKYFEQFCDESIKINNYPVKLDFYCDGCMYNDFDYDYVHYGAFNPQITENIYKSIDLSGYSECMCCGYSTINWPVGNTTSDLICADCDNRCVCYLCGERIGEYDVAEVDEHTVCRWCLGESEQIWYDTLNQEYHFDYLYQNSTIRIVKSLNDIGDWKKSEEFETSEDVLKDNCRWDELFKISSLEESHYDEHYDSYYILTSQLQPEFRKEIEHVLNSREETVA